MPVDVLDPVVGDPMAVSAAGRTLESIALDVANVAGRLRRLTDDSWTGTAAVSAHVRTASLPPRLDKANASYAAAGSALGSYARTLADAQDQSTSAIAAAARASADLASAVAAHAAATARDVAASTAARTAGLAPPPATAPRYEASIDEARSQLTRAAASNDEAHEQQRQAARTAATALQQASHAGIHNQSWFQHVTHSVAHWASTHWTATLREISKIGTVVSALAGAAALILAVAGVAFPPLEAAAAALETVSLVSAVAAGMADTALAATGEGSWTAVGVDALSFAPAGLGKLVTKAAPLIREGRLLKPSTVVHASDGSMSGRAVIRIPTEESWADPTTLAEHSRQHGRHVGTTTQDEYAAKASEFFQRAQLHDLPTKITENGITRVFEPTTGLFGSYAPDGRTYTFFRPTSPTYWDRQSGNLMGGTPYGLHVPSVWLPGP